MSIPQEKIALSFFPLTKQRFSFRIYRRLYQEGETSDDYPECARYSLPESIAKDDRYQSHWVCFDATNDFTAFECAADTNIYLTNKYLFRLLESRCRANLAEDRFIVHEGYRQWIGFVLDHYEEGDQVVWLEPYFLKSSGIFGFLADFKFEASRDVTLSRRILQLSLSLDRDGKSNQNYYLNKYEKIQRFVSEYEPQVFALRDGLAIGTTLHTLEADSLDTKRYVFAEDKLGHSQFIGVKNHGPLKAVDDNTKVYFLYREHDKSFSHDLFRALRGDTFSYNFPGMERMFQYRFDGTNVGGSSIRDYSPTSLDASILDLKKDANERPVVAVVIVPFDKFDGGESKKIYYTAKHTFLRHGIPSQFVSLGLLQRKNQLKWAISNIGLQLFAKMGGQPWQVVPKTQRSLIVGIGQAHEISSDGIKKYFAYSILTESTGLYKELKILSKSTAKGSYIQSFKQNLKTILQQYHEHYDSFVIHATFSIRRDELEAIEEVLQDLHGNHGNKEFVVVKFNDKNKYFGYSTTSNSRVPYESSYVRLSFSEYLVWFEGLQYHKPNVRSKIERPLHIEFVYSCHDLNATKQKDYLQDALNISGTNWRGFNAKSLPISVFYAHLVAEYYKEFQTLGLEEINLETIHPWFL